MSCLLDVLLAPPTAGLLHWWLTSLSDCCHVLLPRLVNDYTSPHHSKHQVDTDGAHISAPIFCLEHSLFKRTWLTLSGRPTWTALYTRVWKSHPPLIPATPGSLPWSRFFSAVSTIQQPRYLLGYAQMSVFPSVEHMFHEGLGGSIACWETYVSQSSGSINFAPVEFLWLTINFQWRMVTGFLASGQALPNTSFNWHHKDPITSGKNAYISFEVRSHNALSLALNFWSPHLRLPRAVITNLHHHACL